MTPEGHELTDAELEIEQRAVWATVQLIRPLAAPQRLRVLQWLMAWMQSERPDYFGGHWGED